MSVGIESEKLSDIYTDVNDRVGEFIQTGGGEMKDFFEKIAPKVNVTAQAFKGLSGPDALQLYYTSLEKAGLNQQEMTFYMESMADEASGLIPLLRKNGEQMKSLSDDAKRLGLVMSEEMIKKSGEAQKKLNALENVLSAKLAVAVASNSDKIIGMADRLETLAVRAEKAWIWLNKLSDSRLGQAVGWLNDKASYLSTTGLMVRGLDELSAPAPAASGGSRPAAARPAGMRPLSGSSPDMWKNMTFPTQYQNRFAGGGFPGAMSPIEGFDPGGLVDALAQVTAGLEKIETGGEDAAAAIHQCGIELKGLKGMLPEDTEAEMALIIDRARELKVEAKDMAGELQQAFRDVRENGIDALSDGITEAIMGSESLGDVFKSVASQIVADLLRIAVRRSIVEPLADAMFGGQGGGGLLKSAGMALGGFFAEGGRPPMGKVSVVGERGPELFVPDRPGTIVPNNAIAAMRAIQVPNVALRAPSQQTIVRQTIMVDARGSVMNDEFAAGILARSKSYAADARDQAIKASVGAVPARMARFDRDGF
jgi:hypothetical protein